MKFTRSLVILSSVLALTSACSKKDDNKAAPTNQDNPVVQGPRESVQVDYKNAPNLVVTTEGEGDKQVQKVQLTFPLGGDLLSTYKGELKGSDGSDLTSENENEASTITVLAYGPKNELIVAVRETSTDSMGLVQTAFLFVKNAEGKYLFHKNQNETSVSQAKQEYSAKAKEEAKFQEWYVETLKQAEAKAAANAQTPATPPAPEDQPAPTEDDKGTSEDKQEEKKEEPKEDSKKEDKKGKEDSKG